LSIHDLLRYISKKRLLKQFRNIDKQAKKMRETKFNHSKSMEMTDLLTTIEYWIRIITTTKKKKTA